MKQEDLVENMKVISIITVVIIMFIVVIPYMLMGDTINNFVGSNSSENLNSVASQVVLEVKGEDKAKVYRTDKGKVDTIPVEEYIMGVLWSEMPVDFHEEALKAQAIAARTFYYSKREAKCKQAKDGEICDGVHCQAYMNKEERLGKWDSKVKDKNYNRVKKAVEDTKGIVLSYDGKLVLYPQYFSTSWGKTENAEDVFSSKVPYLESVDSPGEEVSPRYEESKGISNKEFVRIFKEKYSDSNLESKDLKKSIQIDGRTKGGSVEKIKVGNKEIDGSEFRKIFDLKSANFQLEFAKDSVVIKSKGFGHGVGMSQWGANIMGQKGKGYEEILKHYYSGVEMGKISYK